MVRKAEHERRAELIAATIREIAATGSLNVTTSQIAKSAGVSSGLAFHYFKDKDSLFLAAMREILKDYGAEVRAGQAKARTPRERLAAIAAGSFGQGNFRRQTIAAWLNFYTLALKSREARKLLYVYQRRLHSNLVHDLRPLIGERAPDVARRVAGLIDGLYLRYALDETDSDGHEGAEHILRAITAECTEVHENDDISIEDVDPSPMDPIAKPQE
nr:transcriptional regulator BetI [uncultured Cohaesibacter sp.]